MAAAKPPGEASTELLLDLAQALHAAAVPADVAEERLRGVAGALGIDAQFFTLQSFFATELRRGDAERVELLTAGEHESGASFFDVILLAVQLGIGILGAGLLFRRRTRRPRVAAAATASP